MNRETKRERNSNVFMRVEKKKKKYSERESEIVLFRTMKREKERD